MDLVDLDIESWNPGEKSFDWLGIEPKAFVLLTEEEVAKLAEEPDRLYFVKWKHLSYLESTWEPESLLDSR